ncbi:hypothetical protein LCGC14_2681580, partial [marine sediment metagenome]
SAGALRAAKIIVSKVAQDDWDEDFAHIIDHETGMAELLRSVAELREALTLCIHHINAFDNGFWMRSHHASVVKQAIAKCESGTGRDGSYYDTIPQDGSSE